MVGSGLADSVARPPGIRFDASLNGTFPFGSVEWKALMAGSAVSRDGMASASPDIEQLKEIS